MVCTFAGHRELYSSGVKNRLDSALSSLLQAGDRQFVFYTGGMGAFDGLCAAAVRAAKRSHPQLDIRLVLVLPYLSGALNADRDYLERSFDELLFPDELTGAHYKAAIQKRNRWMVDRSDLVICCVLREFGGAYRTMRYAQRCGKEVLNLA